MTAAIGHPTLRLLRWTIGDWTIDGMQPAQWRQVASLIEDAASAKCGRAEP
jgi:23S rRNA pseudouridine2457 synthase